ncbi:juxtaposed with another zinc finger protein 1 [Achroia grisella]|uniref:juxtaposed with another zinc finger protein 1 n=1 Tax=Achroia grisella TaxID=688607 RepID=UPI0027D20A95|nr:juxtaposed with another zinc finger protein 1 [Achroia grisella]
MAVFMINICKFNACGIIFPRLPQLIEHIEDVHIDYDPEVIEQKEASQPACVPLSYVLRFYTHSSKREINNMPPASDVRRRHPSAPTTPSVRSSTPTGSEIDEDEMISESEDSNDSWTTVEEYSSDYILRYGIKMNANASSGALGPAAQEKPFACPVPGCNKRYKNVNGIKYHSKNGHKKDGKIKKAYKCQCGKSYKTSQGLRGHSISYHMTQGSPPPPPPQPQPQVAGIVVTASPAHSFATLGSLGTLDGKKLVRIYDSIRTKHLPSFTIPKHSLASLNIVQARQPGPSTSNPAPGSSQVDNKKPGSPKVNLQKARPSKPPTPNKGDDMSD